MANYQTSRATSSKLVLGNYKIEVALTTVGGSYIDLGAGQVNSFAHVVEKFDVQSGNSPDPIEGISKETFTVDMELIEWDGTALSTIQGGMTNFTSAGSGGTAYTITGGGNSSITPRIFRLTNSTIYSGTVKTTIITIFRATMDNGMAVTAKSDNDTDPIQVMPITLTGKPDTTLTSGSQLFSIVRQV